MTPPATSPRRRSGAGPDAPPDRRLRGFEPAGRLLQGRIAQGGAKRGFAAATALLTRWAEIAGPDLARVTRPVRVGRGARGATLTLLVAPAWSPVVEMQREALRARVNAALGHAAVARIALTQTAAQGFARPPPPAPFPTAPFPTAPAAPRGAAPEIGPVRDGGLRAALERLARNVAARAAAAPQATKDMR